MCNILNALLIIFLNCTFVIANNSYATDSLLNVLNKSNSLEEKVTICRHLADDNLDTPAYKKYLLMMYSYADSMADTDKMVNALDDIIMDETYTTCHKDTLDKYIGLLLKTAQPDIVNKLLPVYQMRIFDTRCSLNEENEAVQEQINYLDTKTKKESIYQSIATTYILGSGFYINGEKKKALPYLTKAVEMVKDLPDDVRHRYKKIVLRRLCFTLAQTGETKESLNIMIDLINSVEEDYRINYQKHRPFYKINLYLLQYYSYMVTASGLPHLSIEQEEFYWNKVKEIGKTLINDFDRYNFYFSASNYYANNRTKRDFGKAIAAYDTLIKISKILAPQNLSGLYRNMALLCETSNDLKSALKYQKVSYQLLDSLNKEKLNKQISELQAKYDVKNLNSEKTLLELQQKKIVISFLGVLLALFTISSVYLLLTNKKERKLKLELDRLYHKVQESELLKQEFINSICHEIRTPLNAIVGFSELLSEEDADSSMKAELSLQIRKNSTTLDNLVSSMLDAANIDISEEKLPCEDIDINAILSNEMEKMEQKPEIEYKLNLPLESYSIHTNQRYLSQAIGNLLDNANKFTKSGSITLDYIFEEDQKKVLIRVTDTGSKIPQEKHEEVFGRFVKLDAFTSGAGLGLYLCRIIVKRLEGEIRINPDYTQGTQVIISLPVS